MKILYFSGSKLPSQNAQSVHCMKMAQAFANAGHEVTLFAKGVPGAKEEEIFQAYNTEDNFSLQLSAFINIPFLSGAARRMDITGKIKRSPTPDLVYGADILALSLFCSKHIKIVFEAHKLPDPKTKSRLFQKLIKSPNFRGIVATSDILKQDFLNAYPSLDAERIFVAHDGAVIINRLLEKSKNSVLLNGRNNVLKVGYVGSLHAGKGISFIEKLAKLRPQYDFHIVGGTEKLVQKAQTDNFYSNLFYYGHRNHSDIPSYLEAFDIVLAPYQHRLLVKTGRNTTRWLSPIKIFEYMAAKKPILCSDLPILHEVLEHEHNALLLSPSDEKLWANALDMLKNNPELAQKLAENAYSDLTEKFTWEKRAEAVLKFCVEKPQIFRLAQAS